MSHAPSARSKYYRRVALCFVATALVALTSKIVMPEWRLVWWIVWVPILSYVHWRYWIRLRRDGYFECDECRKLKHSKHVKEFVEPCSGARYVWCDVCLSEMRRRARDMRSIRSIIAGMLMNERHHESKRNHPRSYRPMEKPPFAPSGLSRTDEVIIMPRRVSAGRDISVSSPDFRQPKQA